MTITGLTIQEIAAELDIPYRTAQKRLQRSGIEPITTGVLYPPEALEAIRNVPGKGRPPKKTDSHPETNPQTFEVREPGQQHLPQLRCKVDP